MAAAPISIPAIVPFVLSEYHVSGSMLPLYQAKLPGRTDQAELPNLVLLSKPHHHHPHLGPPGLEMSQVLPFSQEPHVCCHFISAYADSRAAADASIVLSGAGNEPGCGALPRHFLKHNRGRFRLSAMVCQAPESPSHVSKPRHKRRACFC